MAVAYVKAHPSNSNKAGAVPYLQTTLDSAVPEGNILLATFAYDNSGANAPAPSYQPTGWTLLKVGYTLQTGAGAGVNLAIWQSDGRAYNSGQLLEWGLATAVAAKALVVTEWSGADPLLTLAGTPVASATSVALTTAYATYTTGDLWTWGVASETSSTISGATGNGGSDVATSGGSSVTNASVKHRYIGGTTTTQTATVVDGVGIMVLLKKYVEPTITQAAYQFFADGTESGAAALAGQDTAPSVNIGSGPVNLALRVRLQESNTALVWNQDDFQLQFEKNANGIWNPVDQIGGFLQAAYPKPVGGGANAGAIYNTTWRADQVVGNGKPLVRASWWLYKSGTPNGTIQADIYASSAAFGSGLPTGPSLATSAPLDPLTFGSSSDIPVDFEFDGSFTPTAGTAYFIAATTTNTAATGLYIWYHNSSSHPGVQASWNGTAWSSLGGDAYYQFWTAPADMVAPYASPNLLTLAASYPFSMREGTQQFSASYSRAQSFLGTGAPLTLAGFMLSRAATPVTGTITAKLWASDGNLATGKPTGAPLAVSSTVLNATAVTTTEAAFYFDFDGFQLVNNNTYFIGLTGNGLSGAILAAADGLDSAHVGVSSGDSSGAWVNQSQGIDIVFEVYTGTSTTSRLTGGTGSFTAGKTSTSGTVGNLGWPKANHTELLYSMRVGGADLADADTLRFRVVRKGAITGVTSTLTYTQVPTLTASLVHVPTEYTVTGVLDVTTSVSAAVSRTTLPTTTALAVTTSRTAAASVVKVYTATTVPLAVTTSVTAAATRTRIATPTALAVTTNRTAATSRATFVAPAAALAVTTNRTAAVAKTTLPPTTALAVTTSRTADASIVGAPVHTVTTVPLTITTSISAAATRTKLTTTTALAATATIAADATVTPSAPPLEDPSDITGLAVWLDADDPATITQSLGQVSYWQDKSPAGLVLSQSIPGNRPITGAATINGRNVLSFGDDYLHLPVYNLPQPITMFVLTRSNSVDGTNRQVIGHWSNNPTIYVTANTWNTYNGSNLASGIALDTEPHVVSTTFNGSDSSIWVDGVLGANGTMFTNGWNNTNLAVGAGAPGSYYWLGEVGEVVIYDRVLSPSERGQVEGYLRAKWLIPPDGTYRTHGTYRAHLTYHSQPLGVSYTVTTVPLAVTTTISAAQTRTTLPSTTALAVTTSRTAAATRTRLATTTALAVTTSRTAAVAKTTTTIATALAVTTSRTAAATRTALVTPTALAVTTARTATVTKTTSATTTALAVTTSRTAAATRTTFLTTTALAVTTTRTATAVRTAAPAAAALAVTTSRTATAVRTAAPATAALAVTTSRTATAARETFVSATALTVTTSRTAAATRTTLAATTALAVTTSRTAAVTKTTTVGTTALAVTTLVVAATIPTAYVSGALVVTTSRTATTSRVTSVATTALAVTTSRIAATGRTTAVSTTALAVTTSRAAAVIKVTITGTTALAVTTTAIAATIPGGFVSAPALAVTTSRTATTSRVTFVAPTALAVVTSRTAAASRVTFLTTTALAVTTSRTAAATRTRLATTTALAITTSRTAATSRVTTVTTTALLITTVISAVPARGAIVSTVALTVTTSRTAAASRITYVTSTTLMVTTTLSTTTRLLARVPTVALTVITTRYAELSGLDMGNVIVDGTKKTVVMRWVVIGGAKKPVVNSWVVAGGAKHPVT